MADKLGEWSDTKDATEVTQMICNEVKGQVEKKTAKNYVVYKADKYRSQNMETGMNFLIKVHVGGADYIHLSVVFIPTLPRSIEMLRGVEQHKTKDDPLEPFTN